MTTSYTLTGDFATILGAARLPRIVRATVSTNLPLDAALVDLDANEIRMSGPARLTVASDGSFSVSLIATNSTGTNVADGTLRYRVDVVYVDDGQRDPRTWTSGWFDLVANSDLSDKVGGAGALDVTVAPAPSLIDAATAANVDNSASDTRAALNGVYVRAARRPVDLLNYAAADGTNQTANVQAAIDATAAGGTLEVPAGYEFRVDGQLNITKAMTIFSLGRGGFYSGVTGTTAQKMFAVTAGGVHFRGVKVRGPQFATSASQRGIDFTGTAAAMLENVSVIDCEISEWAHYGLIASYVTDFQFDRNKVHDIGYAAMITLTGTHGSMDNNVIDNVTQATGYTNSYGIAVSRNYGTLAAEPRSANISIRGNRVSGIPNWAGIDTHGGQGLVISGNVITGCKKPVTCVSSLNESSASVFAPLDITIEGNQVDSGVTDGTFDSLHIIGNSTQQASGCRVTGNMVRGHGPGTSSQGGGLQFQYTTGLVVSGNTVIEPSPIGITFVSNNTGFVCTGNTIVDPWSNNVGTRAIMLFDDYNTGHIDRNTLLTAGKTATYTASNGIGVGINSTAANNSVYLGANDMAAAQTRLYDSVNKSKFAAFGSNGGAKPAALTQTYSTADRTLGAYTADVESSAYTGTPADAASTAKLDDLNALRAAYENLRVHHEDLAQFVNALVDDLQSFGIES